MPYVADIMVSRRGICDTYFLAMAVARYINTVEFHLRIRFVGGFTKDASCRTITDISVPIVYPVTQVVLLISCRTDRSFDTAHALPTPNSSTPHWALQPRHETPRCRQQSESIGKTCIQKSEKCGRTDLTNDFVAKLDETSLVSLNTQAIVRGKT